MLACIRVRVQSLAQQNELVLRFVGQTSRVLARSRLQQWDHFMRSVADLSSAYVYVNPAQVLPMFLAVPFVLIFLGGWCPNVPFVLMFLDGCGVVVGFMLMAVIISLTVRFHRVNQVAGHADTRVPCALAPHMAMKSISLAATLVGVSNASAVAMPFYSFTSAMRACVAHRAGCGRLCL